MTVTRDLGQDALEEIAATWKVSSRLICGSDGFNWWPGDFRVYVDISPNRSQPNHCDLSIQTDVLWDIPIADDNFIDGAAVSAGLASSTYAWVYPPASYWAAQPGPGDRPSMAFACKAIVTPENKTWMPQLVAHMSIMQMVNAQIQAHKLAELLGGEAYASTPAERRPEAFHPIMQTLADVYVPAGREASCWAGTDEFRQFASTHGPSDWCFGYGDEVSLMLKTPFGSDSALIIMTANRTHPQVGAGLWARIVLPVFGTALATARECSVLNWTDLNWGGPPLFGCWHPDEVSEGHTGIVFTSFVPNALFYPGLATQMASWLMERVRWARTTRWPDLRDMTMLQILQRPD